MRYYICHTMDRYSVYDGDLVWMLIRGNPMYKKTPKYLNPTKYSKTQTIVRSSTDFYFNRIFKHEQAMLDYYIANKPTIFKKIRNRIRELL